VGAGRCRIGCGREIAVGHKTMCRECKVSVAARSALGSARHTAALLALWEAQGTCALTGRPLSWGDAHLDHVIPTSKGGKRVLSNVRWLCAMANIAKRDHSDADVIAFAIDVVKTHAPWLLASAENDCPANTVPSESEVALDFDAERAQAPSMHTTHATHTTHTTRVATQGQTAAQGAA